MQYQSNPLSMMQDQDMMDIFSSIMQEMGNKDTTIVQADEETDTDSDTDDSEFDSDDNDSDDNESSDENTSKDEDIANV